jgi:UDP-N-acetylglucosamine--N-acetylmuramyl-(pentapeptide) pyrophosphoryl-undecaprenol N-acetylglucosamine transferase
MARVFLIAAGGTGGHLFPGIAVADELKHRDGQARIVFVGTPRGLESRLVPRAGYPLELLPILPLKGTGAVGVVRGLVALPRALLRAVSLLRRERPEAVLGVGGYAGGPLVLAAALLGVRTVILEPNARPGFTNRVLGPFVRKAACAYDEARREFGKKGVLTGNPVRGGFAALPSRSHTPPLTLLAFGGSQGSRVLNLSLGAALPKLPAASALRIVHQTGEAMVGEVAAQYQAAGRQAEVVAFLDDMEARFAQADLVVCRSGATTCAELSAAGRASVLVPFARSADDHQKRNAQAMVAAGAAQMLEEHELDSLAGVIGELVGSPARIAEMERAARRLGKPDAAERVADLVEGKA